ncbi:MAG TPA: DUF1292 domain-containing protein [Myxococcota bacterium]|nr:DUF1292 domain-containing protein [Myxococcota bacterium]
MREVDDVEEPEPELEVVTLPDEDGNERDFALMTMVELDEGTFAVFAPVDQLDDVENPSIDLYAFSYTEAEDGTVDLQPIDDEALLDRVFEIAEEILFGDEDEE